MTSKTGISSAFLVSFLLLWGQIVSGQYQGPDTTLKPPVGNSAKIVVKATVAYEVRTCVNGNWTVSSGYAKLVDPKTNQVVGNYTSVTDTDGFLGIFALFNSKGDVAESGDTASVVRGRAVAVSTDAEQPAVLLESESHDNLGLASTVSYIQVYNIARGDTSAIGSCRAENSQANGGVTVSFTADVCLWTQDPLPASVPEQLQSTGRVIDGFYGKGNITYRSNGSAWTEVSREGKLYNLPGTPALGQFSEKDGVQLWQISDPNGFTVYAKKDSPDVWVSSTSTPWTLSRVTSTPNSRWSLGRFSDVQTTSTRGGLPASTTASVVAEASEQKFGFSAIYWFYTNDFPLLTHGN